MVAALELYLDSSADRRIRALWDAIEAEGVQSIRSLFPTLHRPHLSLAVAERLDPERVAAALAGFVTAAPLPITLQFVGQFVGRVLWLGPAPSAALLAHHAQVYERLASAGIDIWEQYQPDEWVPHCTVSMRVANPLIGIAVRRCLETLPIEATIVGAAVADHARGISHALA